MKRNKQTLAFTLIELLMVIAIIGILAGILIPAVGAVRKQANIVASKTQLANYVTAITMFKGEYGYFPFLDAQIDGGKKVNDLEDDFVETLSGRDKDGKAVAKGGNRRSIGFHSFSETEYLPIDEGGDPENPIIVDRFYNSNIFIVIDSDGDNIVKARDGKEVRTPVTAYVNAIPNTSEDLAAGAPAYQLYDE